ncbi:hypothetical protein LTS15_004947 [Exophiala xenobiotica]|nr:hypothetical protein LTS15_004947 [Exophiala xenobiotica]
MAMTQRTGDPRLGMRRSYVDGVEDLAYVLGTRLINYGSVIGAELVKSAMSKSKAGNTRSETASNPPEHPGLHQEVEVHPAANTQTNATVSGSPVDLPSKRPNSEPDAMDIDQREPKCARKHDPAPRQTSSARKSTPGGFGQSQQQDGPNQEEIQLREQIKSMKVDLEEDATGLGWDEVFGLGAHQGYPRRVRDVLPPFSTSNKKVTPPLNNRHPSIWPSRHRGNISHQELCGQVQLVIIRYPS